MDRASLLRAANAADQAAEAVTPEAERAAVMAVMREQEALQIGLMYAQLNRVSATPHLQERLPVCDDGDVIGVVEARIPEDLLFRLGQQKNFGWEGIFSDEGQRDIRKAHPFTEVKTVSGKTISGYGSKRTGRVQFGRGTMTFAD